MAEGVIPLRKAPTTTTPVPVVEEPKYPSEVIPLPTKGWFYPEGHPLSTGEIEVKQMTAREEDLLSNQELIKKGKVLDKLLETLIVNKNIKLDEILTPDKNAIFMAIRRLAYGDDYIVLITCPSCATQNKVAINLGNLQYKPFNFDSCKKGENSFTFKLPNGKTITYKILNGIDDVSIDAEISNFKKLSKDGNTRDWTTRIKYVVTTIDGNSDKGFIRKFVDEQLMAKDSLALRRHIRETSPDVDMTFDFKCEDCSNERRLDIPMGISFLWPDFDSRR
jgi:hypothetical protein